MREITSSMNDKLQSDQQTPSAKADPRMSVKVSRARTTVMDSDYWTVETIRERANLGDVSVAPRRNKAYGPPNRIYEIHVEDGIVKAAIREYPDKLKVGWQEQFTIGPGSAVAIAFDGWWEEYRRLWRLVTEDKPWIFWVDSSQNLWRQLWDDESTRFQMDSQVTYVRAIRAWKNRFFMTQDHGVVAAYIKVNGTVWYRNYCQQANGSRLWETAKQVTGFTGTAASLNLFITNDYRMGLVIADTGRKIHWLITPRNWASMAIESSKITIAPRAKTELLKVIYHHVHADEKITVAASVNVSDLLFGRTDNSVVEVKNVPVTRLDQDEEPYEDWGFKVRFRLRYETKTTPAVAMIDVMTSAVLPIKSVTAVEEGYEYEVLVDDTLLEFGINIVDGNVKIILTGMTNEAGYSYEIIEEQFTPVNLIYPDLPLPEVEAIWNE